MRRRIAVLAVIAAALSAPAALAHLDHAVPSLTGTAPPLSSQFNSGGENAEWELLATLPSGNPHSDLDYFTQGGEIYASVGVLGVAANGGGQSIVRLTGKDGAVAPEFVSNHPSAACPQDPSASLGLQHDVEATPKGDVLFNTDVADARRTDAQLLLDATDAPGRCHDQGLAGVQNAPRGGLEIIDITDVTKPKEIGFTSHIGQSHTVNVDPRRPHIAYSVTSDSVSVSNGERTDPSRALDGFEIVDLRSCLEAPLGTIPSGASIDEKRASCRPEVYRYRYPSAKIALGHTNQGSIYGCHELEVYPDDRLTCGSGAAMIVFDMAGAFDDNGTPSDYTDDKPRGQRLPCRVRDSSTSLPYKSGAKVTDCVIGENDVDLGIPGWKAIGSPSLEGVEHVGSAFHMGRESATGALQPDYGAGEDIDFDHEAEFTHSRRFVLATDERGGGVLGGAQCSPGVDLEFANGGLHAYRVDKLQKSTPEGATAKERADKAFEAYARNSKGDKAIFRAPVRTQPEGSFCTAHVFQQIPGQNRIFMGWYSQGTQVVDFTENADGTVDFKSAGYFIPENANQWVSSIFKYEENPDGSFTYYGATGDGIVGAGAGRSAIDVYKVTLPAPPAPAPRPGEEQAPGNSAAAPGNGAATPGNGAPRSPASGTQGREASAPASACTASSGFQRVSARARGRGLRLSFTRRAVEPVTAEVFQASTASRPIRDRRVARFTGRGSGVVWKGRRNLKAGMYYARFRMRTATGGTDVRRVTLRYTGRRFVLAREHHRPDSCGLVRSAKLSSPAFGGRSAKRLGVAFRLSRAARVTVTVTRAGKRVKRWSARTFAAGRTHRLVLGARGLRKGEHRVIITAKRGARKATVRLASRRL